MNRASILFIASLAVAGCTQSSSPEDVAESEDALRTSYGELESTLDGADLDRWYEVRSKLKAGFDNICGDTICSGDYSNLTTVHLACSSTRAQKKMKDCLWVLAGNIDVVDGRTGKLTTDARTFECHVPVNSNAKKLLDTLHPAGDDALNTVVPGTSGTFYDALVECFAGVVGPRLPEQTHSFYSELADHDSSFYSTRRALADSFDQECGDTFCEGDFPQISALRLACVVNANTKRVSRCGWSFAGADVTVDARGMLSARTMTKRCDFPVGASATQLATALSGDDALHAPLPGRTTSIHDALIGCL
jgi:hypothetical protein